MDELLALIGQNWRLVLVYPGGLSALGATCIMIALSSQRGGARSALNVGDVMIAAVWLLVITLLPLPQAGWSYDLDLPLLLLAIEVPYLFRLHANAATERVATLLNVYPLLALAIAVLGQDAGTLVLHDINRAGGWLHWAGIGAWASALPPLLGIGPWHADTDPLPALRRVAHGAALLAAAIPAHETTWRLSVALGFAALALSLAALDRWWRADEQHWIAWQPWLCAALALLLAILSAQRLAGRLG